jgi:hypothetical protein
MSCDGSADLIEDISGAIHTAIAGIDDTILTQNDFTKPYTISKSGRYILSENIMFNFYPNPYDIFDVETTGNDLFGFPAGIKITAKNVILDLSGHTIFQGVQDFCVQRFFALIQLNNSPFAIGAGPIPQSRCTLESASYCIIRNGELGLTSHQAVLGNDNSNLIFEDLKISDFEVTGVTLNNVNTAYFNRVTITRSIGVNRILPVSPYWSSLIFNYRLLKLTFLKFFITVCEQNSIVNTNNHIRSALTPFLNVIYNNRTLTCIYEQIKHLACKIYPYNKFLFNESKLSPCGVHGIKITGPNPSVTQFHQTIDDDPEKRKSQNIFIWDSSINKLIAQVNPTVCVTKNKKNVHIGAGLKLTADIMNSKIVQSLLSTMSLLRRNPRIAPFIRTNVDDTVINFVKTGENPNGIMGFDGAFDMMGHLNKGVMALRIGSTCHVDLSGVIITNIRNLGKQLNPCVLDCLKKKYKVCKIDMSSDTFLSPMNYHGTYAMGAIFSGSENCDISKCDIYDITAPYGAAVGLAVNNVCKTINISDTNIYDLVSCSTCFDSATFVIDEKSTNIATTNLKLNPASTTA